MRYAKRQSDAKDAPVLQAQTCRCPQLESRAGTSLVVNVVNAVIDIQNKTPFVQFIHFTKRANPECLKEPLRNSKGYNL